MTKPSIKIIKSILLIVFVLAFGVIGFTMIEGWKPLDSLYMTVITLSTIGYGEIRPLSDMGRIFTIVLIILSIGAVTYNVGSIMGYIVEGRLNAYFKVRRMEKLLSGLKDHYIICGAGRTGHAIMEEFVEAKVPFVVIDKDLIERLSLFRGIRLRTIS